MRCHGPHFSLFGLISVVMSLSTGCDPTASFGTDVSDGAGGGSPAALLPEEVSLVAMKDGRPVALDPATLDVRASALPAGEAFRFGVGGSIGSPGGVAVLGFDEDETGATVWLSGAGGVRELGTFSGALAAATLPFGCLVFSSAEGERWAFAKREGGFAKSVPCPRPNSVRAVAIGEGAATVEGVGLDADGALSSIAAKIEGGVLTSCEVTPLEVTGSEDARLVELASPTVRALVDLQAGQLLVTPLDGMRGGEPIRVEATSQHLEQVVGVPTQDGATLVVALVSSPTFVHVLRVEPSGDGVGLSLASNALVPLPGEAARAERVPGTGLVVSGDRIFVATSAGLSVFTYDATVSRVDSVTERAELAGPLALVSRD